MACEDQISTEDLENAKLDAITQAEISTSRLGGVATGDLIFTSTDRFGNSHLTVEGALARIGSNPINGGVWAVGQTFNAYNDYMVFSGVAYKPKASTALPYVSEASPNTTNVEPFLVDSSQAANVSLTLDGTTTDVSEYLNAIMCSDYPAVRALDSSELPDGQHIQVSGFSDPWEVKTGTVTDDGFYLVFGDDSNRYAKSTSEVFNVKIFGALGDGSTDDTVAIMAAIERWRDALTATLYVPDGYYVCRQVWNLANLGSAVKTVRGERSWIDFDSMGNEPALVDMFNSKELTIERLRFRHSGNFDDLSSTAPLTGILMARNVGNDFSGRHQLVDVRVSGIYQLASLYNSGCEEIWYDDCEFRNTLEDRRALVITCSNHLGATTSFGDITVSAISTTLNTFNQPAFYSNADARECVCIRGAGGLTMINPYSSAGGFAHYAIQAIDQACTAIKFTGYQCEVERGSTSISADYAFRFEGDGTKDISGCEFSEQFTTTVIGEMVIDGLRDFKRNIINTGGDITMIGSSRDAEGCDIKAAGGIDLSMFDNLYGTELYCASSTDVSLPTISKGVNLRTNDLDAPVLVGQLKSKTAANTVSIDAAMLAISGSTVIENFSSDTLSGPLLLQKTYAYAVSGTVTIADQGSGTGNIRTDTESDIILTSNRYVEIIYIANSDKYYVRYIGG